MSSADDASTFTKPAPKFSLPDASTSVVDKKNIGIPCYKLSSGYDMPVVAFGTFRCKPGGEIKQAVLDAIQAGYRHFDLAHVYGNEAEIGEALQQAIAQGLIQKRSELFLTSKLWNTDHEPHIVPQALEYTMKNLQVDYLDLYLVRRRRLLMIPLL
jgi:aldehyde reductase